MSSPDAITAVEPEDGFPPIRPEMRDPGWGAGHHIGPSAIGQPGDAILDDELTITFRFSPPHKLSPALMWHFAARLETAVADWCAGDGQLVMRPLGTDKSLPSFERIGTRQ